MPEKIKGNFIDHISIACFDVLKAEQDYINTFGWEVAERYYDPDSHINVTCFTVGPTIVEVMEDEFSGGWYELQDLTGKVVISGLGNSTRWVKKATPKPEGKMADVGYWISKANHGREGIQLVSVNVDDVNKEVPKLKANGAVIIPEKGTNKEIRVWPEKKRNYAFIHPKSMHGLLLEVIDGKYDSQKGK
jgi:catechol 2,3-dioxygenase-like lactoylglutathione lyase family enzyme